MNDTAVWIIILLISLIFALLNYLAINDGKQKIITLLEIWRHFINYFFTATIGYFFIAIRWPIINKIGDLSGSDYLIIIVLLIGTLGWWPYIVKNVTEGLGVVSTFITKKWLP